ncbi:hypothetical protein GQ53DRAFT_805883 [Thozetella sp. PMI_491]|nr:hypothetical protein GQ53DRAFT_805883 [Thozetella sp. PMI_491]
MRDPAKEAVPVFVHYEGPRLPRGLGVRRLIRRRAMRDVAAARRKKGDYGKHNLGQYPQFQETSVQAETKSPEDPRLALPRVLVRQHHVNPKSQECLIRVSAAPSCGASYFLVPPTPAPASNLPVLKDFAILLTLRQLTGLRLGVGTVTLSQRFSEPGESSASSSLGSWNLVSFLPSRYGRVPALRHATDCVIAKLRRKHDSSSGVPHRDVSVLAHYHKALCALQAALDDESQRMLPETLFAAQLLGIFELLDENPETRSWRRHARGAARLIEVRGAQRFHSDFESELFIAHVGSIVTEAFLSNTPCFLADGQWKSVMRSAICRDVSFSGHQEIALRLWGHLVDGPRAFKETTDLILSPVMPPQAVIEDTIQFLHKDREGQLRWLEMAKQELGPGTSKKPDLWSDAWAESLQPSLAKIEPYDKDITRFALGGTYIFCRMLKARLLFALAPSRFPELEAESQDLAARIVSLSDRWAGAAGEGLVQSLFMSQSAWLARGVLETREAWSNGWGQEGGMIEKWRFEAWCRAIGRQIPAI